MDDLTLYAEAIDQNGRVRTFARQGVCLAHHTVSVTHIAALYARHTPRPGRTGSGMRHHSALGQAPFL